MTPSTRTFFSPSPALLVFLAASLSESSARVHSTRGEGSREREHDRTSGERESERGEREGGEVTRFFLWFAGGNKREVSGCLLLGRSNTIELSRHFRQNRTRTDPPAPRSSAKASSMSMTPRPPSPFVCPSYSRSVAPCDRTEGAQIGKFTPKFSPTAKGGVFPTRHRTHRRRHAWEP
jgi:hypothetical protein